MRKWAPFLVAALVVVCPAIDRAAAASPRQQGEGARFALKSSAFRPGGEIPVRYTGEGENISPPLAWSGAPAGTRSFALIVDDPDAPDPAAPRMVWTHWVLLDIPASATGLSEGVKKLPVGAEQGLNDWNRPIYSGPLPPIGRHHYVFTLYALDELLDIPVAPTRTRLEQAMHGHVLAQAALIGTYQSKAK